MTLESETLVRNVDLVERIEKSTLRMVTQALLDFMDEARDIFANETDLVADIGEDITREALDRLGTSVVRARLYGKVDYKRARYVFHPEYSVRQALFVDSKVEKLGGSNTVTIQTAQTSMRIRQIRASSEIDEQGALPTILMIQGVDYLTTTVFVKYNYLDAADDSPRRLHSIVVCCLPNGLLQAKYNPDARHTIWLAGRNAPTRGEPIRVRLSLSRLQDIAPWRVQLIDFADGVTHHWAT